MSIQALTHVVKLEKITCAISALSWSDDWLKNKRQLFIALKSSLHTFFDNSPGCEGQEGWDRENIKGKWEFSSCYLQNIFFSIFAFVCSETASVEKSRDFIWAGTSRNQIFKEENKSPLAVLSNISRQSSSFLRSFWAVCIHARGLCCSSSSLPAPPPPVMPHHLLTFISLFRITQFSSNIQEAIWDKTSFLAFSNLFSCVFNC